jgi:hypothetical protein
VILASYSVGDGLPGALSFATYESDAGAANRCLMTWRVRLDGTREL